MNDMPSNYANALFALCQSVEERSSYAEALRAFDIVMKEHKEISTFLMNPDIEEQEKITVIGKALDAYALPHLLPFIRTIISHHRMGAFSRIVEAYVSLVNQELGVLEGYIYSSSKLSPAELESIEQAFQKKLDKKVMLKNILDPSLLGGVRVSLGGRVYDSSLKGRLDDLRLQLKHGGPSQ